MMKKNRKPYSIYRFLIKPVLFFFALKWGFILLPFCKAVG